jgi:hypothetical protein
MPSGYGGRSDLVHVLNIDTLSSQEWSYLHGLFLTDGCSDISRIRGSPIGYRVIFYFGGKSDDEKASAHKVAGLLKRIGLNPRIKAVPGKRMIIVQVFSKALMRFLPDKNKLRADAKERQRFFEDNGLCDTGDKRGIAFLAGLLDGDGYCKVDVATCRFGLLQQWKWGFTQGKYPFLVDYMRRFIGFLSQDSVNVRMRNDGCSEVRIRKPGIVALLNAGIAEYSWRVGVWLKRIAEARSERAKYYTVGQTARELGVMRKTVRKWLRMGKMTWIRREGNRVRKRTRTVMGRSLSWYYIPIDEVVKLKASLDAERESVRMLKDEGVEFSRLAKMLGVHTLRCIAGIRVERFKQRWLGRGICES